MGVRHADLLPLADASLLSKGQYRSVRRRHSAESQRRVTNAAACTVCSCNRGLRGDFGIRWISDLYWICFRCSCVCVCELFFFVCMFCVCVSVFCVYVCAELRLFSNLYLMPVCLHARVRVYPLFVSHVSPQSNHADLRAQHARVALLSDISPSRVIMQTAGSSMCV